MATDAVAVKRSAGRRLAGLFYGRPRLRIGALLAAPMAWLVILYLGSLLVLLVCTLPTACSTRSKSEITDSAMKDDARRAELIEATLRVMDEHPAYVDELFHATQRHPRVLDRMLENTAVANADQPMAARVAAHLVAHPEGLESVMIATLDAARSHQHARAAIVGAINARAGTAAELLVEHPQELAHVTKAIAERAAADPDTAAKVKEVLKGLVD